MNKTIIKASILSIGDEILIGQILNTNAYNIAKKLVEKGILIVENLTVSDDENEISKGLHYLSKTSELILVTGGLGPTKDDKTKSAISTYFNDHLVQNQQVFNKMEAYLAQRNRLMTPAHLDQTFYPESARILDNDLGTAQGILMEKEDILYLFMPGVPHEMEFILNHSFFSWLHENQYETGQLYHETILTAGIGETTIAEKIKHIEDNLPESIKLSYLPQIGGVRIRLTAMQRTKESLKIMQNTFIDICSILDENVMSKKDMTKMEALHNLLVKADLTIGTAESCSGGLLAHKLTSKPGSSAYFKGSIVAYSNEIKKKLLNVSESTLEKYGSVSKQTVTEMNDGLIHSLETDLAISISGIAGPDGGTLEKPVGTVWLACGNKNNTKTRMLDFNRNRKINIEYATEIAIFEIFKFIRDEYQQPIEN